MKVVVTGASGYIGGQTLLNLVDQGHEVLGIDSRIPPDHLIKTPGVWWHTGDYATEVAFAGIYQFAPDAIVHCAGTSLVGPSVTNPAVYYENNFVKTKQLLDFLIVNNMTSTRIVFSSSAATYGEPVMTPCQEVDPAEPISPYGQSKLMIEWMLASYGKAYGIDSVAFRYFNACGADSRARHGQEPGATHIIAQVLEAIRDGSDQFVLNGKDFATEDGTCIRDYIHVEDLAQAHIRAIDPAVPGGVYNLGTNQGYSNLQILHGAIGITKQDLAYSVGPRRPGDPATLTADSTKFMGASGWQPKFSLEDMITHAWTWYNR
jgi:UDP-glucose-4-epimerase GalE